MSYNPELYTHNLDGTSTIKEFRDEADKIEESEVIHAEISVHAVQSGTSGFNDVPSEVQQELERRLQAVNLELDKYTNHADGVQYAYSIACGILSGIIDSKLFSEIQINGNDIGGIHKAVNRFIENYAKSRGVTGSHLPDWIGGLEKMFPVPQDNVWKGEGIGITPKNHHLADLAHHPTPLGLISALMVQFLRVGTFVNKDGEWHFLFVKTEKEDVIQIAIPALITGILNWLMFISEKKYEDEKEQELPRGIHRLAHIISSTPEIVEIIKCADNWFGHLVSDMGGSKNTAGHGMGIPGVLLSLLQEISSLPILKDSKLPGIVNDLYVRRKIDLRRELLFAETLRMQSGPVIFNEVLTRLGFMLLQLKKEITENKEIKDVNWRNVMPFNNRSVDRCLMISTMTFNVVDTADATFRAAVEAEGNWVLFSRRFVARYNYVGAGRAALAIVKEYSDEKKEEQLIYERMLLMEEKAQIMYQKLQKFKSELEERLTMYLAEDIETFMAGFDLMNEGLASENPNLVIKGNVVIQKILGRKPQFESQEEFDEIMASDVPVEF